MSFSFDRWRVWWDGPNCCRPPFRWWLSSSTATALADQAEQVTIACAISLNIEQRGKCRAAGPSNMKHDVHGDRFACPTATLSPRLPRWNSNMFALLFTCRQDGAGSLLRSPWSPAACSAKSRELPSSASVSSMTFASSIRWIYDSIVRPPECAGSFPITRSCQRSRRRQSSL